MSWLKNAWKSVKKATKSPIFHVVEGGLALAFPEVAIPAAAALTMGNKALDMANSTNATVRAKYRQVVENTEKAAAAGHPGAQRAFQAMKLAKDAKAGNKAALAEVAKIRAHAAHHRLAGQAVVKRYQMHPRTGIVSVHPRHIARGYRMPTMPQQVAGDDDDYAPEDQNDESADAQNDNSDQGGGADDGGGSGGGGGGGGSGPADASAAAAISDANSSDPEKQAKGRAAIAHAVKHAKAGHPVAKRHVKALAKAHAAHHAPARKPAHHAAAHHAPPAKHKRR